MNRLINCYGNFESERLKIKNNRVVYLKSNHAMIKLAKNQHKLLICLIAEINCKQKIIERLWGGGDTSHDNKYNQLIFKLRKSLSAAGFPDDTILTIHRYGVCLNKNLLVKKTDPLLMKHDTLI
ncbi:helix-turn-helix domain-containing protein [Enterobacter kobei]|uniref:winged helix-turn-helix domain-containing protein n=1 Tax=Enterobacter kobei TaxID=208224 RepID=UPI00200393BE|nr:helix-turn-helix domain-containing protein [Enterobacter kobei]MCK6960789.1 helix-turn-helix domain-containing protein [Enterobacter kobei]